MWFWVWISPLVVVIASIVHCVLATRPLPPGRLLEIVVLHALFWGVGVRGIVMAYLMGTEPSAQQLASELGWSARSPFQAMAAGRLLALGIGGIGVIWFRGSWILAMTIAAPLYGWAELVLWTVQEVPAPVLGSAAVYNVAGGLVLIGLVLAYRWRAGPHRFWAHTASFEEQ